MVDRLAGQVAVVSGAGRGFGRQIALGLAKEGAAVALLSRSASELETVAEEIRSAGGTAIVAPADVADPRLVATACEGVTTALGVPTILVSNAAIPGPFGPLWETDSDRWWQAQAIHIRGPYNLMRALVPGMITAGGGRVICTSAIAAVKTLPNLSAYSTGKAALNKLVEMAAAEGAAHKVRVFAIEPGFVITQLAHDTYNDPDAKKWFPEMLEYLDAGRDRPDGDRDLFLTAERVVRIAAGDYDVLSGRYIELPDPIDEWKADAEATA